MSKETSVKLIQEKIQDLQTALFFPETSQQIQMPNYVVDSAKADEEGNVWFIISRPVQYIEQEELKFPCKLDFFKKGKPFHLKLQGKACLYSNFYKFNFPFPIADLKERMENKQSIVVKMEIEYADYFEIPPIHESKSSQDSIGILVNWLFKSQYVQRSRRLIYTNTQSERFA